MTDEQVLVLNFLQCSPETWFTRKEISRRATRRSLFEENPHWADAALGDLLVKELIEKDKNGLFRLKKDSVLHP